MKNLLTSLLLLSLALTGSAQYNCKTTKTDNGETETCYLQSGKKSTVIFTPAATPRWRTLTAYDGIGKVIYEKDYGQRWGSSGVEVRYYPNGALKSARYTMQPDGGIQHTDITTFFTPEGKFDHEENMSIGNNGIMGPGPGFVQQQKPAVTKPNVSKPNECAPVPANSFCLINNTSDVLKITAQYKPIAAQAFDKQIEPRDTVLIGSYYPKSNTENPLNDYSVTVRNTTRSGYSFQLKHLPGNNSTTQYVAVYVRRNGRRN